ncbi:MAG: glycosyltransferase family 39 protein [Thermodesulfobacteriota bacterium]|nr:glycosyltransferase family 39 protein [Thermodesulfobacteriota bacterium]
MYLFFVFHVISIDGIKFLAQTECFKQGDFVKGLEFAFHPLYPITIAIFSHFIHDTQLAAQLISIISGSLLVIPVFFLGRKLFNHSIGFITGLLVAFHPHLVRKSVDVLSESLYILFFMMCIYIGWSAIKRGKSLLYFLAGAFGALAYLTRPEGLIALVGIGIWIFIIRLKERSLSNKKVLTSLFLLLFGFTVFASPYLMYLRGETGHWTLTKKKSTLKLMGIDTNGDESSKIDKNNSNTEYSVKQNTKYLWNEDENIQQPPIHVYSGIRSENLKRSYEFLSRLIDAFHPLLFLFCLIGIYASRGIRRYDKAHLFVFSICIIYLLIAYSLLLNYGYISRRHLLPAIVMSLFWTAIGIQESQRWRIKNILKPRESKYFRPKTIFTFMVIFTVVFLLPKTLKPQRVEKIWIKETAQWLQSISSKKPKILSHDPRIDYYAGGSGLLRIYHGLSFEDIKSFIQKHEADYIVLTPHEIAEIDGVSSFTAGHKRLELIREFIDGKGWKQFVYEVRE